MADRQGADHLVGAKGVPGMASSAMRSALATWLVAGVACGGMVCTGFATCSRPVLAAPLHVPQASKGASAVQDVGRSDGLHALPVTSVQADALPRVGEVEPALFLPCDGTTGLAAFWSGPELMVVVDRTLPALFHLPGAGGPFDRRESVALNGATLLRLYLPDHPHIVAVRQKAGWLLCVPRKDGQGQCSAPASMPAVTLEPKPGRVVFAQSAPGRVVTLPDPATGGRLFVGTTRQVETALPPRAGVGYAVRPAVLGVVVAADSAQLAMQSTPYGPVLEALAGQPMPVGLPAPPPSASVRRGQDWFWLGLKDDPAPVLLQQWRKARDGLGQAGEDPAKVLADQPEAVAMTMWAVRVAAAQVAFAAGYPQQAWGLLQALPLPGAVRAAGAGQPQSTPVRKDWPGPGVQALRACAALLSGDLAGAAPLATAEWAFEPDMALWRGAYFMASGADSQPTAVLLARGYARLEQYPAPVRALLMPRVSQYLAQFGGLDERAVLGTLPDDPEYNLARILVQARNGQAETARVALENLTASGDDRMADHARAQLVGFMLDHDQIAPDMAVEAYAQLLAAQAAEGGRRGRGAQDHAPEQAETDFVAALRVAYARALVQAGRPAQAAGVLDGVGVSAQVPRDRLEGAWRTVLVGLIFGTPHSVADAGREHAAKGRVGPVVASGTAKEQQFALARAHMEQVPDDPLKAKLLAALGRQLVAQGQAAQAVPVLQQADVLAIEPLMRADIEEQLAQAAVESNQRPLALRALERSALPDLPEDLAARRRYDEARLAAASGNRDGAQALLADDESDMGLSVRGALYEQDKQWAQAVLVLGRLASRNLPEQGVLTAEQRDLVIRLASDATDAGDAATVRNLQAWVGGRALGAERQALFAALLRQVEKAPVVSLGQGGMPTLFDKSVKHSK